MTNQETMTKLPTPRSLQDLLEEKANFYVSIGDGPSIGGEIDGVDLDVPIWIEHDYDNEGFYYVHYQLVDRDTFIAKNLKAADILTETGDYDKYVEAMQGTSFTKNCYSVEELIETLNSIK